MIKTLEFMNLRLVMGVKEKIQLERALGNQSPLNFIFGMMGGDIEQLDMSKMKLPSLEFIVTVLFYASQKLNNGITKEKMMELVDEFLEEDENSVMSLLPIVIEVLKQAKYLPNEANVEVE